MYTHTFYLEIGAIVFLGFLKGSLTAKPFIRMWIQEEPSHYNYKYDPKWKAGSEVSGRKHLIGPFLRL